MNRLKNGVLIIRKLKVSNILCSLFRIILGIAFIAFCGYSLINRALLLNSGHYTYAVVTEINEAFGRERPKVEYSLDGVVYSRSIDIQPARINLDEEVVIYYDSDNPKNITPRDKYNAGPVVFSALGGVTCLLIEFFEYKQFKKRRITYSIREM